MDVDDVSQVDQWMELLKGQKIKLQAASKQKGERPWARESRAQLIQQFMLRYTAKTMFHPREDQHLIHQSWVASPYPPSVASLESLKKVFLSDLCLETHHRGSYLLLKVATPPNTMTAVMAIMDDEKGDATMVQLYQQKNTDNGLGEEVVQKERVCIVKEPYFKIMNDGGYGLRVDHVSDVIWPLSDDERIPRVWRTQENKVEETAEKLKAEGNVAMKAGNLTGAMEM